MCIRDRYVPARQLDLVSKYIGSGDGEQEHKLSRLGGTDWEKAKTKAKKAVADLAKGLIQLYAERQRQPGDVYKRQGWPLSPSGGADRPLPAHKWVSRPDNSD